MTSPHRRTGVLVAAAEPLHRLGLTAALSDRFPVVAAVGTARAAAHAFASNKPPAAVLVLDPALPDAPLEQACASLIARQPATATLVLLREPTRHAVRLACRAGACGVHHIGIGEEQLCAALVQIAAGEAAIHPTLARHLVGTDGPPPGAATAPPLTRGQLNVMRLLVRGYSTKEIAVELSTSVTAVHHTIERAGQRLGAAHRAQAVALALERGLIA
jgi:DNA-binding NarL/FixJ family response regulator